MQNWDYGWPASYFITICTKNREKYFGEIVNHCMRLSQIGFIADLLWNEISAHRQNIKPGPFVVMPNHIHGILIIMNDNTVETRHALSLRSNHPKQQNHPNQQNDIATENNIAPRTPGQKRFQNQGCNTVSSIVGGYKSAVSKHVHHLGLKFQWQPRFWDHVIRDAAEFQRIRKYIINNPLKWKEDEFHF